MSKYIRIRDIEQNQLEFMTDLDEIAYREMIADLELEHVLLRLQLEQARDYYENDHDDEFWYSD